MKSRIVYVLVSAFSIFFLFLIFIYGNKNKTYKCQATINASILHSNINLNAHITTIHNDKSRKISYTVIGEIKKGDVEYILLRDGNILLSENKKMRKVLSEHITPLDTDKKHLWEDNFLTRKYNIEYYQDDIEINDQLIFMKGLSGPILVCVKSPI
ncbi:hypothetical protein NEU17_004296 [Salmonella enterica]|nr:hypothetical protein [Salmonella enterica]EEN9822045.1 hypothetical protein [Salmonella enterica]EGG6836070.1 hypothetical protein [Salmonella enterica]EIG9020315.1 hypothetical protein [Salmonella enterica]EIL7821066.1 hypothetical protein [Salmonella enterica]